MSTKKIVEIISYDSTGKLKLFIRGRTYFYYDVPEYQLRKLKQLIKKNSWRGAFKLLANYSNREKFKYELER